MAGIYWNETEGLISLSSDGESWITISDKNLGATTVYNDGDTETDANCGSLYQRGNNYGFPFGGQGITTTTALVSASGYGPGNYYSDSTFRSSSYSGNYIWDNSFNNNLRGGTTNTDAARQGPCESGFHIPSSSSLSILNTTLSSLGLTFNINNGKTYLKMPLGGILNQYGEFVTNDTNLTLWTSDHWDNYNGLYVYLYSGGYGGNSGRNKAYGLHIRPFKNEPVIPDYNDVWTTLYGDELPDRPIPPVPVKKLKRIIDGGNFYYFDEAPTHASSVTLNESSITLTEAGQTYQLTATVSPNDAVIKKVHWSSSDITVATVTQTGLVTCVTPGECTITATCDGVSATCDVVNIVDIYVQFLLVGGGGGGGTSYDRGGGGGGAGGVIYCSSDILCSGDYCVTIGSGGAGANNYNCCNGKDSCFNGIIAYGGGGGASAAGNYCNGGSGGSGGGAGGTGCSYTYGGYGGNGCTGQGNKGGDSRTNSLQYYGSGGGGAGGVGESPTSGGYGGNGGSGVTYNISGVSRIYGAGGGGGGYYAGSSSGGGDGGAYQGGVGGDAVCYGSGGGGGGSSGNNCYVRGGAGCQGIFILRYPTACGYNVTGGTKYTCGNYTIHCFTSNGTLTVS